MCVQTEEEEKKEEEKQRWMTLAIYSVDLRREAMKRVNGYESAGDSDDEFIE